MKRTALFLGLMLAMAPLLAQGQPVIRHPQPDEALAQKWQWAADAARQGAAREGYWIGYSIERMMGEYSTIGSWSSHTRYPTLHELLTGEKLEFVDRPRDHKSERKVIKEVGLLFEFVPGEAGIHRVRVSTPSGQVNLHDRPLYWLGGAANGESLDFIQQQFDRASDVEIKEAFVMALSIHDVPDRVVPLLSGILTGGEDDEVREQAAFWLGQHGGEAALDVLKRTAEADRAEDVREQAVFAISQMEGAAATETLIGLARSGPRDIRKNAVFWLGQKASDRAVEALGEMVHDDADTEVQKQAVFALSQLPEDEGVPMLIEIARTHQKPKLRKEAIFWLSQTDDPRALEALIQMARG